MDKKERVVSMRATHAEAPDALKHTSYRRWNPYEEAGAAEMACGASTGLHNNGNGGHGNENDIARDVQIVTASCRGWRVNMEDFVRFELVRQRPMVVLCDGHGGDQVASYTVQHLFDKVEEAIDAADSGHKKLTTLVEECVDEIESEMRLHLAASSHSQEDGSHPHLRIEHSVDDAHTERPTDPTTISPSSVRSRNNTRTTAASEDEFGHSDVGSKDVSLEELEDESCGTTLTMCLVEPTCILTCNVGDSRAIRATGGIQQALTEDHVPHLPKEKQRIENAGGAVINGRVFGGLSMSRSIGDFVYKRDPTHPVVISTPDVMVHPRNPEDEFILVASDGLWNVFSEAEACACVRRKLRETGGAAQVVAEYLIDQCLLRDSRDNISVALIVFPAAFRHLLPVHRSYEFVLGWGEHEVRRWLAVVNLTEVIESMPADKLTGEFLISVNDDNHKDLLGGMKMGHRKKLVKKIKTLRDGVSGWSETDVVRWLQFEQLDFLIPCMKARHATGMDLCRMRPDDLELLCTSPSTKRSLSEFLSPGSWRRSRKRSDSREAYDSGSEDVGRMSREPSQRVVSEHEQDTAPRPEVLHACQRIEALVQGLDSVTIQAFLLAAKPKSPRNLAGRTRLRSLSSECTMESSSPAPSITLTESEDHTMSSISECTPSPSGSVTRDLSISVSPADRFADEVIAQLSAPENVSEISSHSDREDGSPTKRTGQESTEPINLGSPSQPKSPRRGIMWLFRNASSESNGTGTETHLPENSTPRTTDPALSGFSSYDPQQEDASGALNSKHDDQDDGYDDAAAVNMGCGCSIQ